MAKVIRNTLSVAATSVSLVMPNFVAISGSAGAIMDDPSGVTKV